MLIHLSYEDIYMHSSNDSEGQTQETNVQYKLYYWVILPNPHRINLPLPKLFVASI